MVFQPDEVANEVNLWAEKNTKGFIKDLLPPKTVDSLTRLIIANALYFKGEWRETFDASMTKDYDFHLLNGTAVKVPFMVSEQEQFIGVFNGFKVLCLPYKHGRDNRRFSMHIILPEANDGLSALIEQVTYDSGFLERHLPRKKVEVGDFRIPIYKFSFGLGISNLFKEMKLVLRFSLTDADLTNMVDPHMCRENLYVSNILHKSFIEVNEEGTRTVAVTNANVDGCVMPCTHYNVTDFVADHPFLFMIREDFTGTILFIGQVLHPLDE